MPDALVPDALNDLLATVVLVASVWLAPALVRALGALFDAREARAVAAETWVTFEPADDFERWLLQRNEQTLDEFLEKSERDREAVAQRATHSGAVDVFGYKVLAPRLGDVLAAAGHPVHGTARRWVTGELEVYCLACNLWVAAGAGLEHVHPMEGTA